MVKDWYPFLLTLLGFLLGYTLHWVQVQQKKREILSEIEKIKKIRRTFQDSTGKNSFYNV